MDGERLLLIRARIGMTRRQMARIAMVPEFIVKNAEDGACAEPTKECPLRVLLAVYDALDALHERAREAQRVSVHQ